MIEIIRTKIKKGNSCIISSLHDDCCFSGKSSVHLILDWKICVLPSGFGCTCITCQINLSRAAFYQYNSYIRYSIVWNCLLCFSYLGKTMNSYSNLILVFVLFWSGSIWWLICHLFMLWQSDSNITLIMWQTTRVSFLDLASLTAIRFQLWWLRMWLH